MDRDNKFSFKIKSSNIIIPALIIVSIVCYLILAIGNRDYYYYGLDRSIGYYLYTIYIILFIASQITFAVHILAGSKIKIDKLLPASFFMSSIATFLLLLSSLITFGFRFTEARYFFYWLFLNLSLIASAAGYGLLAYKYKDNSCMQSEDKQTMIAAVIIIASPVFQDILCSLCNNYSTIFQSTMISLLYPFAVFVYLSDIAIVFNKTSLTFKGNKSYRACASYSDLESQLQKIKTSFNNGDFDEEEYKKKKEEILNKLI